MLPLGLIELGGPSSEIPLLKAGEIVTWLADPTDSGDKYMAILFLGKGETSTLIPYSAIGLARDCQIRDLWDTRIWGSSKKVSRPNFQRTAHRCTNYIHNR
jgi:hypothetical protein